MTRDDALRLITDEWLDNRLQDIRRLLPPRATLPGDNAAHEARQTAFRRMLRNDLADLLARAEA